MTGSWQKWVGVVPVAFTLVAAVIAGIVAFTSTTITVDANADEIKSMKRHHEQYRERIRILESNSAATKERLEAIHRTQQEQRVRSIEGRREILNAIMSLSRRVP